MKMKWIKQQISNFKYKWSFLGVLNSPFRGLKLKWYFGKIQHGTPYFLPRRWVKCDLEDGVKAWDKLGERTQEAYIKKYHDKDSWIKHYVKTHTKPIPIKYFGFDFTSLGWKTKWNDYRFEWSPMFSIVLFGKQICIWILPNISPEDNMVTMCYWEAYLTYKYKTDKAKSKTERLTQLKEMYSCSWGNNDKGYTDYYQHILKSKYLK